MIKAVIFDLDDTLYRERDFVDQAFRSVAEVMAGYLAKNGKAPEKEESGNLRSVKAGISPEELFEQMIELMEQEGRYIQHLLYGVPVKRGSGVEVIEDLVPIHGVKVRLRLPRAVKRAYLAPQREELNLDEKGGAVEFEVEEFCCHQMVVLEY